MLPIQRTEIENAYFKLFITKLLQVHENQSQNQILVQNSKM